MTLYSFPLKPSELAEVASLPANLLSALPVPTQLQVQLPGSVQVRMNVVGDLPPSDTLTFASDEVAAIACAVEHGRATAQDVLGWAARKASEPSFHLDHALALAGARPPSELRWSLAQVLREIGAVITSGQMIEVTTASLPHAA